MGEQRFGDLVVHFNALPTMALGEAMAREYGIARSDRKGLLNVSVQRDGEGGTSTAVAARVQGEATNLMGRKQALSFRAVPGAEVSYLATFDAIGPDTYTFALTILPEGAERSLAVRFNHNVSD